MFKQTFLDSIAIINKIILLKSHNCSATFSHNFSFLKSLLSKLLSSRTFQNRNILHQLIYEHLQYKKKKLHVKYTSTSCSKKSIELFSYVIFLRKRAFLLSITFDFESTYPRTLAPREQHKNTVSHRNSLPATLLSDQLPQ